MRKPFKIHKVGFNFLWWRKIDGHVSLKDYGLKQPAKVRWILEIYRTRIFFMELSDLNFKLTSEM